MKPNLTQAEANHLRRLLGWVRCEVGQTPDEIVSTMQQLAPKLPEPNADAKARLVEHHAQAAAVPKYVRAAVKALEKLLVKQEGVVVDVEPGSLQAPLSAGGIAGGGTRHGPPSNSERVALPAPAVTVLVDGWSSEAPAEPGYYFFNCEENNGDAEILRVVEASDPDFPLSVECPHLGPTEILAFHEGVTRPRWKKVEEHA
ncbi:hypothetical protein [Pseudoxanthomonas winnipegensis]|uniref:Uncharacterized protein n=1 Tax=Pseudoxanthomonas winnipegensis TaxID=2480810 RepID=A0A4Q8LA00_9GAMM|nr:hypothetical protein [Pseudoxanthomonas winnipegensis]TAA25433.1 hypothetical protein EA660_08210 [Pseudoxanthomonas winnipegensis]